jgi:hypothetical protein
MPNPSASWPSECRSTLNITSDRLWAVRLRQHGLKLEERHLKRSRPAQHSRIEKCRILWKEAQIVKVEKNSVYRKYKEATYMPCLQNLSADPALKFLLFGILRSGRSCPNDTFYSVKIHHVSADDVTGVRILNLCVLRFSVLCLGSDQSSWLFYGLYDFNLLCVPGAIFFSLVAFNFSVHFSRYNSRTCSFLRGLSTLVECFFGTQ